MLTVQGWIVAGASLALLGAGRIFGVVELYLLGAAGLALVVAAGAVVARTRLRLDVARELHPSRLHAGGPSRVELLLANRGTRRTPLLSLRDTVGTGRSASVVVAPLTPGEEVKATYRLPTDRRGIVPIGPLRVEVTDPFGLASSTTEAAPHAELTVWPAVDDVPPLPHTVGDDPHGGADHPNALTMSGEDFYALRPYVRGDDLRHVHWRSTARRDELMVRQDELPWQGRATVLLDTRAGSHTEATFERAVSGAASVVLACNRRRFLVRLLTTGGSDTGVGSGATHIDLALELLATVEVDAGGDLGRAVAGLRGASTGAAAVLLGGRSADAEAVGRLRRSFARCATVVFEDGDTTPFPVLWQAALRTPAGARR